MQPNVTEILEGLSLALDDLRKDFDSRLAGGNEIAKVQLNLFENQLAETERRYVETLERFSEQAKLREQTADLALEKVEQSLIRKLEGVQESVDALTKEHQNILEGRLLSVENDLGDVENAFEKYEADFWQLGKTLDTLQGHISSTIETIEGEQEKLATSVKSFEENLGKQTEGQQQSVEALREWVLEVKETLASKEAFEGIQEWAKEEIEVLLSRLSNIQTSLRAHIVKVEEKTKQRVLVVTEGFDSQLENHSRILSAHQAQLLEVRQGVEGQLENLTEQFQQLHSSLEVESSRADAGKERLDNLTNRVMVVEEEAIKEREADRLGKLQIVLDDSLAELSEVLSGIENQTQKTLGQLGQLEEAVSGAERAHTALVERVEGIPEGLEAKLAETATCALDAVRDSRAQVQEELLGEIDPLKNDLERLLTRLALTEEQMGEQEKAGRERDRDQTARIIESTQDLLQKVDQRIDLSERKTDELRARIGLEQELYSSKIAEKLRALVDETAARMRLELGPQGKINEARLWMSGREFAPLEIASYRSGLWQARRLTSQEPNCQDGSDWALLAPGLHDIKVEGIPGPRPSLTVGVVDSAGRAVKGSIELPVPRSKGTWDPEAVYGYYDWVIRDGSSWLLNEKESKGEDPAKSDKWSLMSMRGRQGKQGKRGLPGPSMPVSRVFEAIQSFFSRGDGTPIFRFRGVWEYGMTAEVGDVVNFDYSLFLCITRVESAEAPPTYTPGARSSWALMIEVPQGGAAGGGSATDELVGVTANDQAPGHLFDQLESGDGSVIFTILNPGGDEKLDVQATGVGGGQSNVGQNVGDGIEFYRDKTGVALNFRTVGNTARVIASLNGDLVEFTVPDGVFDLIGSAAAVQTALDGHALTNAQSAHPDGINQTDLTNHKSGTSQHSIAGVTGLQAELNSRVLKSGDVMGGYLTLFANPSLNLHAATKQYVDERILRVGDTMTGPLVLAGTPTMPLHAATKQYVDDAPDELVKVSATDSTGKVLEACLVSGDSSISISVINPGGNEQLDIRSLGAGGGEANRGENIGGGPGWYAGMSGFNLQLRTPVNSSSISATLISNNIRFDAIFGLGAGQVAEGNHSHAGVYDPAGSAAAVQTNLDSHANSLVAHGQSLVSGTDTVLGFLGDKLSSGDGTISFTVTNPGVDEGLDVRVPPGTFLTNVIEDTDPYVGGDLKVGGPNNYVVAFTDSLNTEKGATGWVDAAYTGVFLAHAPQQAFDENDGAVLLGPGSADIFGSAIRVNGLQHASQIGYQDVKVAADGTLFGMPPPDPGWYVVDTSTHVGQLPTLGLWVEVTGLEAQPVADVDAGDKLNLNVLLEMRNDSDNRSGEIAVGFGINGAAPTSSGVIFTLGPGFQGTIPVSFATTTHGGLTTSDTVTVWVQRFSQSHAQFDPWLDGSGAEPHELILSVPGAGGGTGGDPTNLSAVPGPTTVVITSSTGTNATILAAVAGGDAGVITGADQQKLDGIAPGAEVNVPANLAAVTAPTSVDITSSTGTDATIPAAVNAGDAGVMTGADKEKLDGIEPQATADQTDAEIEIAYNNQVPQVTGPEKTAGTETDVRRFSPQDIADMAGTHGAPGGVPADATLDGYTETGVVVAYQATWNAPLDGRPRYMQLTGDLNISNDTPPVAPVCGGSKIILQQDATGGHTVGYSASWYWPDGTLTAMPSGANEILAIMLDSTPDGRVEARAQVMSQ